METMPNMYLKGGKERMKKLKKIILFSMLLTIILLSNKVFATTGTYRDSDDDVLEYEINNNEVTITRYQGRQTGDGEVIIPDTINGYPVVKIGQDAFTDTGLVKITLPNTLKTIADYAFVDTDLKTINIPASVTNIGNSVFSSNYGLTNISVNSNSKNYCSINGVLYTKNKDTIICYPMAKSGTSYNILNGVTTIADKAFLFTDLTDIIIPNTVTKIGNWAFSGNLKLKKIELPSNITTIGDCAFSDNSALTEVISQSNPQNLGKDIFGIFGRIRWFSK